jgi:hypothetical protein
MVNSLGSTIIVDGPTRPCIALFYKVFWDNLVSWSRLAANSDDAGCVPVWLLYVIYTLPDPIEWMGIGAHRLQDNVFQLSSEGYKSSSVSYKLETLTSGGSSSTD